MDVLQIEKEKEREIIKERSLILVLSFRLSHSRLLALRSRESAHFLHLLILVGAASAGSIRGGGVVLLRRVGQQMLLQMGLLREKLEAELTLVGSVTRVNLLVAKKIRFAAEELVAFAAVEVGSVAFLALGGVRGFGLSLGLGFFRLLGGLFDVGGGGSGRHHFRRGRERFLPTVMLLSLLLRLVRGFRLDLLELMRLLRLLMMLLLLLLDVNGLIFLARLR